VWCRSNFRELVRESSASADKDMVDRPDLDRHVFCRVLEDCGHVALDRHGCAFCFVVTLRRTLRRCLPLVARLMLTGTAPRQHTSLATAGVATVCACNWVGAPRASRAHGAALHWLRQLDGTRGRV